MQATPAQQGTTTHTARPAHVSTGEYSNQRRFGPSEYSAFTLSISTEHEHAHATVYRDGTKDSAELILTVGLSTKNTFTAELDPRHLRELAYHLLDAAHDIETLPAAVLARAQQEAAA